MLYNPRMASDKKNTNRLYSFLYLLLFYLGIDLLPIEKWIPEASLASFVRLLVLFCLLLLVIKEAYQNRREEQETIRRKRDYFALLPFVFGFASNLFYALFFHQERKDAITSAVALSVFTVLGMAAIEEILFRYLLLSYFENLFSNKKQKEILSVLCSSLCFSLMHVINFYGNAYGAVFAQLGYTLLLGIILGFLAVLFETPLLPLLGHFLYNFFNMTLYSGLYSTTFSVSYVIYSAAIGIVLTAYSFLLFVLFTRSKKTPIEEQ